MEIRSWFAYGLPKHFEQQDTRLKITDSLLSFISLSTRQNVDFAGLNAHLEPPSTIVEKMEPRSITPVAERVDEEIDHAEYSHEQDSTNHEIAPLQGKKEKRRKIPPYLRPRLEAFFDRGKHLVSRIKTIVPKKTNKQPKCYRYFPFLLLPIEIQITILRLALSIRPRNARYVHRALSPASLPLPYYNPLTKATNPQHEGLFARPHPFLLVSHHFKALALHIQPPCLGIYNKFGQILAPPQVSANLKKDRFFIAQEILDLPLQYKIPALDIIKRLFVIYDTVPGSNTFDRIARLPEANTVYFLHRALWEGVKSGKLFGIRVRAEAIRDDTWRPRIERKLQMAIEAAHYRTRLLRIMEGRTRGADIRFARVTMRSGKEGRIIKGLMRVPRDVNDSIKMKRYEKDRKTKEERLRREENLRRENANRDWW